MINLMYIVFIALMGLGIHRKTDPHKSKSTPEQVLSSEPIAERERSVSDTASIMALVSPEDTSVPMGSPYRAQVRLVKSVDTAGLVLYLNGHKSNANNVLQIPTTTPGLHTYNGYIQYIRNNGVSEQYPFRGQYEVIEPTVSITPQLMNILYAGIDNPISLAVAGVSNDRLSLRVEGGDIHSRDNLWYIRPNKREGVCKLSVYRTDDQGRTLFITSQEMRVRPLPPPSPFVPLKEGERFRGGMIARAKLIAAGGVKAGIDDGIIDLDYKVESFQTIAFDAMGNAIPEVSNGSLFSERQLRQLQNYPRGKRLYISEIKARGADGVLHAIPTLELIIQ